MTNKFNETHEINGIENVIIVGGGPAGLAAAIYNARANLKPLVFAGSPPGGQLVLTSEVENYPGFESILGPDLIEKMKIQAVKFGTRVINENILNVDFSKQPLTVSTSGKTYQAKAILIATGAKALWLGLENETRLRGKGVSACATCDGFFFRDKTVAVVGGGDTAMEEANTLTKFAKTVYIIHRKNEFRASQIMQDRVKSNPKIHMIYNAEVVDVLGEQKVERVRIRNTQTIKKSDNQNIQHSEFSEFSEIKLDGLFIAIGHKPDTDLFKGKINLDRKGYIITAQRKAVDMAQTFDNSMIKDSSLNNRLIESSNNFKFQSATSVPGVFAAGDCVDYIYRQAATAAGMGVAAALDIEKYLEIRNSDLSKN